MFRRGLIAVLLGTLVLLVAPVSPAGADTCRQGCEVTANDGVIPDLTGSSAGTPPARRGLLARSDAPTPLPMLAILAGLGILGTTLTVISVRRRAARVIHVRVSPATARLLHFSDELPSEPSLLH